MNPLEPTQIVTLVAGVSVFALVLCLWGILLWSWQLHRQARQQRLHARLGLDDPDTDHARQLALWRHGKVTSTYVPDAGHLSLWRWLEKLHQDAGYKRPLASILLGLVGVIALLGLMTLAWTSSLLAVLGIAAATTLVYWIMLKRRILQRAMLFDQQLIDALELAARSLRAGHPLSGAFQLIAQEIPEPVGHRFAEICEQEHLGMSHEESMHRIAISAHNSDLKLFATSVAIQLRSGGNLADMMDRLSAVIRDRMRLNRRVRVLTAQTQMSKNVLLALPVVMFALLALLNPDYIAPLYQSPSGRIMLVVAVAGLLVGTWMMGQLARLRY